MQLAPTQATPHITIDALAEHIAVIDGSGKIVQVNQAWRDFAAPNGGDPRLLCEGANYLEVCDRAASGGCDDAARTAALLREALAGLRRTATLDYACHAPGERRWFSLKLTVLDGAAAPMLVLAHENVTGITLAQEQIRFQAGLLASVEQAVIATDLAGRILYWNPYAARLYGWTPEEAVGHNVLDLVPAEGALDRTGQIMARLQAGQSWAGEFMVRHRDGHSFPMHVTDSPIRDEQGRLIGIIGISTDISEWKKTERALQLSAMVYQAIGEAIMITSGDHQIVAVNPAFVKLSGYAEEELIGQSAAMLLAGPRGASPNAALLERLDKVGHIQGKVWSMHKNGGEYAEWLRIDTIYDERGDVRYRVDMFSGITDQKLAEDVIWRQANFDPLTGLPNRSMFHDRLDHEMCKSRRSGLPLALMLIDIDHFKEINDTLGHDAGDLLLQQMAQRLTACIRQADTVARLGGDEFTVILGELDDLDSVERVAHAMLGALAEPFHVRAETLYLSGSIGITLFPHDAAEVDTLLKHADQAMYDAKSRGRNQFSYFMRAMQLAAQSRMRTISDLRAALPQEQLHLLYQPIVELATGKIRKAEALLRWHHPQRGTVSPAEFIPLAEESGLIVAIGDWVIEQALQQAICWRTEIDPAFQITVNMSPVQFRKQGASARHAQLLCASQSPGENAGAELVVEITENMLMESSASIREQLLSFRDNGIEVSIDDFGTGYSSLSYLKKFDIDYLKIDQSFVLKMHADSDDLALCEAIVVMGHKLGIKVIAEGVETLEQRDLLARAGCDYGQGFLFSGPLSPRQLTPLLREGFTSAISELAAAHQNGRAMMVHAAPSSPIPEA